LHFKVEGPAEQKFQSFVQRVFDVRISLLLTCLIFSSVASIALSSTFSCVVDRKVGFAKSIPSQISFETKANSRKILVRDNVSNALGKSSVRGQEDGLRPRFRRFTWELRSVPNGYLPPTVRAGGRKLILYAATIDHGTNNLKISATFIQGTAAPVFGERHEGRGKCKLNS
jgi:hypothetical protein